VFEVFVDRGLAIREDCGEREQKEGWKAGLRPYQSNLPPDVRPRQQARPSPDATDQLVTIVFRQLAVTDAR